MGRKPPRRSTLADADRRRDPGLFFDPLLAMLPCMARAGQPVYFALTPAKTSDIGAARRLLPIEMGATSHESPHFRIP